MKPLSSRQNSAVDIELLGRCKAAVREIVPKADVVLYGSRARGNASQDSDYDILILVDAPADMALKENILANIYPLELDSGQMLTLVVYNKQQWNSALYRAMPFHKNVERDGVLL